MHIYIYKFTFSHISMIKLNACSLSLRYIGNNYMY